MDPLEEEKIVCSVPCQRYQDFRHPLRNLKIPKNIMGFNNHNLSNKLLNGFKKKRAGKGMDFA